MFLFNWILGSILIFRGVLKNDGPDMNFHQSIHIPKLQRLHQLALEISRATSSDHLVTSFIFCV